MRYQILNQLRQPHSRVICDIDAPGPEGTGVDLQGHVAGQVELTNTGKSVVARGRVGGEALLCCSRCLKEFPWSFTIDFTENCALRQTDDPAQYQVDEEAEELVPILDEEIVDLGELVRQLVAVEVPWRPLCRPDCAGLCPDCGADLNEGPCRCEERPADPRWAKLKDLTDH